MLKPLKNTAIKLNILIFFLLVICTPLKAQDSFSVLVYHHVSKHSPPITSVTPEQFAQHLDALIEEGFTVVDLQEALEAVLQKKALPKKAVAITFDDGFEDIHQNAFPLLKARSMPFTVFVSTDPIDQSFKNMMSWEQVRELKAYGAHIANHTRDHDYMVRKDAYDENWINKSWQNINHAQKRIEQELGQAPLWFAYPYGEYNEQLKQSFKDFGWIGFGQQSGSIGPNSDFQALPRYPAAGIYANWKTLRVKLNSKPMPILYDQLPDPVTTQKRPRLIVNFSETLASHKQLACYINGQRVIPTWSKNLKFFSVQSPEDLKLGRQRYNCTAPSDEKGRYYWMSHQWLIREAKIN